MKVSKKDVLEILNDFLKFVKLCPSSYQTIEEIVRRCEEKGFVKIAEECIKTKDKKVLTKGYVTRNDSSVILFNIPKNVKNIKGFRIVSAHSDSPMFKLKENADYAVSNYDLLDVEKYGGMILQSFFDRPLGIAGRVVFEDKNGELVSKNVNLEGSVCMIPNLPIHLSQKDKQGVSVQNEMQPIVADGPVLLKVAKKLKISKDKILGYDLYVVNNEDGNIIGDGDFFMSPRIDDLECVYGGLKALLESEADNYINVLAVFDNEEVGSLSRNGASSDFLIRTLKSLAKRLDIYEDFDRLTEESFMISADNAHAFNPNYASRFDKVNRPIINKGVVIKYHGSLKYTTDAYTGAFVKKLCIDNNIDYQTYNNNSDVLGGSTLGNLVMSNFSVKSCDIGLAQFAMHSAYETAGGLDLLGYVKLLKSFY